MDCLLPFNGQDFHALSKTVYPFKLYMRPITYLKMIVGEMQGKAATMAIM